MSTGTAYESTPAIELLGQDHPDRPAALRLIVGAGELSTAQADQNVSVLLDSIEHQSLNIDLLLAARVNGRLVSACLAIESPGRTALVFLGPSADRAILTACGAHLLTELQSLAWKRDVVLLQALLEANVTDVSVYREAGFHYLAELVYQDCLLAEPRRPIRRRVSTGPGELIHLTYSHELEEQFIRVLQASYVESLDCPKLTGLRNTSDVLLGHKHTGLHDPNLWFLAMRADKPVGVLLMSEVVGRAYLEIVYTGVAAEERGQGIGDALLGLAIDVGRRRSKEQLTLAVDSTNVYALRLYQRWGFVEVARRRVWIASNPSCGGPESETSTKFSTL